MTHRPFRYPTEESLRDLVNAQREGHRLETLFVLAADEEDPSDAFELLLALRIAGYTPPRFAVPGFLLALQASQPSDHEWRPFALALVALGPDDAAAATRALFERFQRLERKDDNTKLLGELHSALALYVLQRMGAPLPEAALLVLDQLAPFFEDPHARACLDLLHDDAGPLVPIADSIKRFVDWALGTSLEAWMRAPSEPPLSGVVSRKGRKP